MRRILYTRPDGGISIIVPVISRDDIKEFTEADAEARAWDNSIPAEAINPRFIEEADVPKERGFRNAWIADGAKIKTDMEKARAIHMDRIRAARNAELVKLDISQMTAISKSDTIEMTKIEAQKETLRDLPDTFDLTIAKTEGELIELWPPELVKTK